MGEELGRVPHEQLLYPYRLEWVQGLMPTDFPEWEQFYWCFVTWNSCPKFVHNLWLHPVYSVEPITHPLSHYVDLAPAYLCRCWVSRRHPLTSSSLCVSAGPGRSVLLLLCGTSGDQHNQLRTRYNVALQCTLSTALHKLQRTDSLRVASICSPIFTPKVNGFWKNLVFTTRIF
jgi:hypothetical protein